MSTEYQRAAYTRRGSKHIRQLSHDMFSLYSDTFDYYPLQPEDTDVDEITDYGLITRKVVTVTYSQWRQLTEEQNVPKSRDKRKQITLAPNSNFVISWSFLILFLDATYTAYFLPIYLAFSESFSDFDTSWSWTTVIDVLTMLFFTLDFILSFFIGYIVIYNGERTIVSKYARIFKLYRTKGGFWVDLITVLASWGQVIPPLFLNITQIVSILRIIRVLRMVRLIWVIKVSFKLALSIVEPNHLWLISSTSFHMFCVIYCLATLVNALACLFYRIAWIAPGGMENSWLYEEGLIEAPPPQQYLASIYYVVTTVSTVGYGDVHAVNWVERIVSVMMIAVGVVFFAFLIGMVQELLHQYSQKMRNGKAYKDKMVAVNRWINNRKFSPTLQNDIRTYYTMAVETEEDVDETYVGELPQELRTRVIKEQLDLYVGSIFVLREAPQEFLIQLCSRMTAVNVLLGRDLCQEGDPADSVWFLLEGYISVSRFSVNMQDMHPPCLLVDNSLLNKSLPNLNSRRLCTLTCKTNCRLLAIQAEDLNQIAARYPFTQQRLLEALRKFVEKALSYSQHDPQLDFTLHRIDQQLMADQKEDEGFGFKIPKKTDTAENSNVSLKDLQRLSVQRSLSPQSSLSSSINRSLNRHSVIDVSRLLSPRDSLFRISTDGQNVSHNNLPSNPQSRNQSLHNLFMGL